MHSGCGGISSVSMVTRTKRQIRHSNLGHCCFNPIGWCAARFLELAHHIQKLRRSLQGGVIDSLGDEYAS